PDPRRHESRERLSAPGTHYVARRGVAAQPRTGAEALAQSASAPRAVIPLRARATAARTAVVGLVVIVVPQPEEPDKPQDQQAHVENAETHHENPPLRTDKSDRSSGRQPVQRKPANRTPNYLFGGV